MIAQSSTPSASTGTARSGLQPTRPALRPIPRWVIAIGVPVMVLVAVAAVWLLLGIGVGSDKLDAIRTGGTLGVGLGGAAVLWLAVRRQRSTELDLLHKYDIAQDARNDATERRITELYVKAADQLGSDKAPVRLAGLHALERLAQNHSDQRQTIVNVICAYLRMPYALPTSPETTPRPLGRRRKIRPGLLPPPKLQPTAASPPDLVDTARQEREVRLTAQNILAGHLRPGPIPDHHVDTFWPGIDLDLTGATLIDLDLHKCRVRKARFANATFHGDTWFGEVTFDGYAGFTNAFFSGHTGFVEATFHGDAGFANAEFRGEAGFNWAVFDGHVTFEEATFHGDAGFSMTKVVTDALFDGAQFRARAGFAEATFCGPAMFDGATFDRTAVFARATFAGSAQFTRAKFHGYAAFPTMTFNSDARFGEAAFDGGVPPALAHFVPDALAVGQAEAESALNHPDASA